MDWYYANDITVTTPQSCTPIDRTVDELLFVRWMVNCECDSCECIQHKECAIWKLVRYANIVKNILSFKKPKKKNCLYVYVCVCMFRFVCIYKNEDMEYARICFRRDALNTTTVFGCVKVVSIYKIWFKYITQRRYDVSYPMKFPYDGIDMAQRARYTTNVKGNVVSFSSLEPVRCDIPCRTSSWRMCYVEQNRGKIVVGLNLTTTTINTATVTAVRIPYPWPTNMHALNLIPFQYTERRTLNNYTRWVCWVIQSTDQIRFRFCCSVCVVLRKFQLFTTFSNWLVWFFSIVSVSENKSEMHESGFFRICFCIMCFRQDDVR